jgi:dipeptidyl aminopeptidase/acylaminoacyl peptidase
VADEAGVSTLLRLDVDEGAMETIREGLDAPPRFNSLAVSAGGEEVYLGLVGREPPDPEARHDPEADRDVDIYAIDVATGVLRAAVEEPGDDFFPQVVAGHLYWTHNDLRDAAVVLPATGGDAHVVVEEAQIPYWTPDDRQIGFTYGPWRIADWGLNLDAGVIDVDTEARPASGPSPIVVGYHEDFTPAWSPDGRWMVYHSHRSDGPVAGYASPGSTDDLYLRRASAPGSQEIRLMDFGWEVGMADWAPDSRRLVFDSWERGGTPGLARPWIATIDPDSGEPVSIESLAVPEGFGGTLFAAWSPVRDELAVIEREAGENQSLWLVDLGTGFWTELLHFQASTYGGVDWMPGGEEIVFSALAAGRMQLHVASRAGGPARVLSASRGNLIHPQVSFDGRWIAATRVFRTKELRRLRLD